MFREILHICFSDTFSAFRYFALYSLCLGTNNIKTIKIFSHNTQIWRLWNKNTQPDISKIHRDLQTVKQKKEDQERIFSLFRLPSTTANRRRLKSRDSHYAQLKLEFAF